MMKSAVITGGTGAIGLALCRLLSEQQLTTYVVIRPGSARRDRIPVNAHVQVLEAELGNYAALQDRIPGADAFFHLAWASTTGQGRNDMDSQVRNIAGVLDACRAAKALGCGVFVGSGSQAEYGRVEGQLFPDTPCFPENGYGMAKLCAGQMSRVECRKLGIRHIWPRILSVYGPGDGSQAMIPSVIARLLRGETPQLTAGTQRWDYLYCDDAARALYLLAEHGRDGSVYPLGSGTARPLREYVEILRDCINPALPLDFGAVPYSAQQVMYLQANIGQLQNDTGFEPQTAFESGIRKTIDWVRESEGL